MIAAVSTFMCADHPPHLAHTPPLAEWLRSQTRQIHAEAETTPFHMALIRGRVAADAYGRYLAQLFWVHDALEPALLRLSEEHRGAREMLSTCGLHTARLERDVRFLLGKVPPASLTTQRVRGAIAALESHQQLGLLGAHYVLEGSKNGGRILATVVRHTLSLEGLNGTEYLDPYGDEQSVLWSAYKGEMNRFHFTPDQREKMLVGARMMFGYVIDMCAEIEPE